MRTPASASCKTPRGGQRPSPGPRAGATGDATSLSWPRNCAPPVDEEIHGLGEKGVNVLKSNLALGRPTGRRLEIGEMDWATRGPLRATLTHQNDSGNSGGSYSAQQATGTGGGTCSLAFNIELYTNNVLSGDQGGEGCNQRNDALYADWNQTNPPCSLYSPCWANLWGGGSFVRSVYHKYGVLITSDE